MKVYLFLVLLLPILALSATASHNQPQLLSGTAWGGKLFPCQQLPLDPTRIAIEIEGHRQHGRIHIHSWGPNTTSVTEYNVTALGVNAFDYDLYIDIDGGDASLDYYHDNPGPYNNGQVKELDVSGKWSPRRNGEELLELRIPYKLVTTRALPTGGFRIAGVELMLVISGALVRNQGRLELVGGRTYLRGPAYLNLPATSLPSPYQYVTSVGHITTSGESVNTAYRAVNSANWALTNPVTPYFAKADFRDVSIVNGNLYGVADFYTVAPDGFSPVTILNTTFVGYGLKNDIYPNVIMIEQLQANSAELNRRFHGENFAFFL